MSPQKQKQIWTAIAGAATSFAPIAGPFAPLVIGLAALAGLAGDIAGAGMAVAPTVTRLRRIGPELGKVEAGWQQRLKDRFGP